MISPATRGWWRRAASQPSPCAATSSSASARGEMREVPVLQAHDRPPADASDGRLTQPCSGGPWASGPLVRHRSQACRVVPLLTCRSGGTITCVRRHRGSGCGSARADARRSAFGDCAGRLVEDRGLVGGAEPIARTRCVRVGARDAEVELAQLVDHRLEELGPPSRSSSARTRRRRSPSRWARPQLPSATMTGSTWMPASVSEYAARCPRRARRG